jgi:hypothetical protein
MKLREWSIRRWVLVVAMIIVLLFAGFRLHLKWQVWRALAELKEEGKPVSWEELNRSYPPVADEENSYAAMTNAVNLMPFLDETERNLIPIAGEFLSLAMRRSTGRWRFGRPRNGTWAGSGRASNRR